MQTTRTARLLTERRIVFMEALLWAGMLPQADHFGQGFCSRGSWVAFDDLTRIVWFWFYGTSGQGSRKTSNGRGLTDPAAAGVIGATASQRLRVPRRKSVR